MKLIGIDYGTKRVGIAVSDESGSIAFPKAVYPNNKQLLSDVLTLIKKENASVVVIGESKDMHGQDNAVMTSARQFATDLERESSASIDFEQEFYTSYEAKRSYTEKDHENNIDRKTKKTAPQSVDAEAAAIILNSYILKTKNNKQKI